jgi:hypothetical protein
MHIVSLPSAFVQPVNETPPRWPGRPLHLSLYRRTIHRAASKCQKKCGSKYPNVWESPQIRAWRRSGRAVAGVRACAEEDTSGRHLGHKGGEHAWWPEEELVPMSGHGGGRVPAGAQRRRMLGRWRSRGTGIMRVDGEAAVAAAAAGARSGGWW